MKQSTLSGRVYPLTLSMPPPHPTLPPYIEQGIWSALLGAEANPAEMSAGTGKAAAAADPGIHARRGREVLTHLGYLCSRLSPPLQLLI